jgi:hypothetical protein
VYKKCPHGKQKSKCVECGGKKQVMKKCPHGKQKSKCVECGVKKWVKKKRESSGKLPPQKKRRIAEGVSVPDFRESALEFSKEECPWRVTYVRRGNIKIVGVVANRNLKKGTIIHFPTVKTRPGRYTRRADFEGEMSPGRINIDNNKWEWEDGYEYDSEYDPPKLTDEKWEMYKKNDPGYPWYRSPYNPKKDKYTQDMSAYFRKNKNFFFSEMFQDATAHEFLKMYAFKSKSDTNLVPIIPGSNGGSICDLGMFLNEPPLQDEKYIIDGTSITSPRDENVVVGVQSQNLVNLKRINEGGEMLFSEVILTLTRDVNKDEELVWDYGKDYERSYGTPLRPLSALVSTFTK